MRNLLLPALLPVAICLGQPGEFDMVGVLKGNDYSIRVEYATWLPRIGSPYERMTPGWAVEPGQMDTWTFAAVTDPYAVMLTYFSGGVATCSLVPLVKDSWYDIAGPGGVNPESIAPQVKIYFADSVGCAEEAYSRPAGEMELVANPCRNRAVFRGPWSGGPLEVYSGAGRLVRVLPGPAAGRRDIIVWDGTDDRGSWQPAGVYYCRLRTWPGTPGVGFVLLR